MVTGVATVLLIAVAWIQLGSIGKTSQADFIFRLKGEFFTEKARRLIFLIDYEKLRFIRDEPHHFEVEIPADEEYRPLIETLGIKEKIISPYVVDDDLLGPLEDVASLLKRKAIGKKEVYEVFYTYVKACGESEAILDYIRFQRETPGDEDVYDGFLWLHKELKDYVKKSHIKPSVKLPPKSS
jgi:hypothetical protein